MRNFILLIAFGLLLIPVNQVSAWNTPTALNAGTRYTAWTWTGQGTNANWDNGDNWCGAYINGQCRKQSGAPGPSASVVFNGLCTSNCSPVLNVNVNVRSMHLEADYTGTIDQGAYTVTIGSPGYVQSGGTFKGGSGAITIASVFTSGDFALYGGTFISTSGTLSLYTYNNDFRNATSFVPGTGRVFFGNGNNPNIYPGNWTFKDVQLSVANNRVINIMSNMKVGGDLYVGAAGNAAASINGSSIEVLSGNVYKSGYSISGSTHIKFTGNTAQTLDNSTYIASATHTKMPGIEIAQGSGGSLTLVANTNGIVFTGDVISNGSLGMFYQNGVKVDIQSSSGSTVNTPDFSFADLYISAQSANLTVGQVYVAGNLYLTYTGGSAAAAGGVIEVKGNVIGQGGMIGNIQILMNNSTTAQVVDCSDSAFTFLPYMRFANANGISFVGTPVISRGFIVEDTHITMPATLNLRGNNGVFVTTMGVHLNNLKITGSTGTISSNDSTYVDLNLTGDTTGLVNFNNNRIYLKGDFLSGSATNQGFGGTTTVELNNNGNQSIDFSTGAATIYTPSVAINSTGGKVFFYGKINIRGSTFGYMQGTVDAGTSTMVFDGSLATIIPGTIPFYNVTIVSNSSPVTIFAGQTLTVLGKLSANSSATSKALNGFIDARGDVDFSGNGYNGTVAITMSGTASATLTRTSTLFPTGTFTVNKTGGAKVTLASSVDFGTNQNVSVSAGSIDIGAPAQAMNILGTGTLSLAAGTKIIRSGGTLTINGVSPPDGAYGSGTIDP